MLLELIPYGLDEIFRFDAPFARRQQTLDGILLRPGYDAFDQRAA